MGPSKTMSTTKRVRIMYNGAMIADTEGTTAGALYVWEHEYYPQFYLPMEAFVQPTGFDVKLEAGDSIYDRPSSGAASLSSSSSSLSSSSSKIVVGGFLRLSVKAKDRPESDYKTLTDLALFAADLQGPGKQLRNMVKVRFDAVGQWFEEDTLIYVHPKDPFKRVDILASQRPIRVLLDDVVLAESNHSQHLYETMLPCRYYLPFTSLDASLLRPSLTHMQCPYKGDSSYHNVVVNGREYKDLVWYYTHPTVECTAIAGMCCFYNEKVDIEIMTKGRWVRLERPVTHMA